MNNAESIPFHEEVSQTSIKRFAPRQMKKAHPSNTEDPALSKTKPPRHPFHLRRSHRDDGLKPRGTLHMPREKPTANHISEGYNAATGCSRQLAPPTNMSACKALFDHYSFQIPTDSAQKVAQICVISPYM
jgi:hypothetical protein